MTTGGYTREPTGQRTHSDSRRRLLDVEKRQLPRRPELSCLIVASLGVSWGSDTAVRSGRWYLLEAGYRLVGIEASVGDSVTGDSFTATITTSTSVTLSTVLEVGDSRSGATLTSSAYLGPDDYFVFSAVEDSGSSAGGDQLTIEAILEGPWGLSGGLELWPFTP